MPPTDSPHAVVAELHPQIVEDVKTGLAQRSAVRAATGPESVSVGAVGAIVSPLALALIESTVRSALEYAAQTFGSTGVALTLAYKSQIRAIIGPQVLQYCDTIIHGLQDANLVQGR